MNKPSNIILEAVTGSKAYGLDTASSDEDIKGIYVLPTEEILSLYGYKETIDGKDPDFDYHEVGKFIKLAMKCNPTILEQLFLSDYLILTKEGQMLRDIRKSFLSNTIFNSYGGYALAQAKKLSLRSDYKRYSKHARHCFRLLQQGKQLLETGDMNVKVNNRDELFEIGELPPDELLARFEREFKEFDQIKSVLPDAPDKETINKVLLEIRRMHYEASNVSICE